MKYIFLVLVALLNLYAGVVTAPIISVDKKNKTVTIDIKRVNVGMSGFVVHYITPKHCEIIDNVVVKSIDTNRSEAMLQLSPFHLLDNDSVPQEKFQAKVGDSVELAFGYSRSMLIAPDEAIYHRITKGVQTQWIHPDMFATILALRGHPSPLVSDFHAMSDATSTGILFIYLDKKLYTIDMKSFTILHITTAPLVAKHIKLPFYTRVQKIESSWWDWGKGTSQVKNYTKYYYKLLIQTNPKNKELVALYKKYEKRSKK